MQTNFNARLNLVELYKLGRTDNALIVRLLSKIKSTDMFTHYMKAHGICHVFGQNLAQYLYELDVDLEHTSNPEEYTEEYYSITIRDFYVSSICKVMEYWPKYSGDPKYPVPSTKESTSPQQMYIISKNLWAGEYGHLRKELLDFLIRQYEERK